MEVEVDKGMHDKQQITFSEEGDQYPDTIPGDVVIIIREKESDCGFVRRDDDLIYEAEIELIEALTGFEFIITHLDGRKLLVKSNPGEITKENDIKVIAEEGMPRYRNPFQKGFLFVHFTINWPKSGSIKEEHLKAITSAFPPASKIKKMPEEYEVVSLEEYDENKHESTPSYEEHHEEERQGGCVQQ